MPAHGYVPAVMTKYVLPSADLVSGSCPQVTVEPPTLTVRPSML